MRDNLNLNVDGLKIKTPSGWEDFAGVAFTGNKEIIRLEFDDVWIECTEDHGLYNNFDMMTPAKHWKVGDTIASTNGPLYLTKKVAVGSAKTYDIIEVENGNKFYANNLVSSNCEFISFSETLLDSIFLAGTLNKMGKEPLFKQGNVRWYEKVNPNCTYVVGLDPSVGSGGDNAAIQVLELPSFKQVAEWSHNKTKVKGQMQIMMDILQYIETEMLASPNQRNAPEIYWSVENNSIGDTCLHVIEETGEHAFPGIFQSETGKKRKGYNTTNKNKVAAASRMKFVLEEDKLTIKSKALVSELKMFIRSGAGFAASQGRTDDLVMALMLCLRILEDIMEWDDALRDAVAQQLDYAFEEEYEPLPIMIL